MSRFGGDDCDCDLGCESECRLWILDQANQRRALAGKRGQKVLRELEAALLAMPERRLVNGVLCDAETGEVCALGQLAVHRMERGGLPHELAVKEVAEWEGDDGNAWSTSYWVGKRRLGLAQPLATAVQYQNDEVRSADTPEQRWEHLLAWVRSQIKEVPA